MTNSVRVSSSSTVWTKIGYALGWTLGIALGLGIIALKLAILALVAYGLYLLVT